jgi:tetratricopeptide (TPR) repeat protein
MGKKIIPICSLLMVLMLSAGLATGQGKMDLPLQYERTVEKLGCDDTELSKEGIELWRKGSDLFLTKGKTAEGVKLLEKANEIEPKLTGPYAQLSLYYSLAENNPQKAIGLLQKGIKICPKYPDFYFTLANCYAEAGQHREAIHNLHQAKELGLVINPAYFFNLANSHAKLKEFDKAIAAYKECLALDPNKLNAWRNLAIAHYEKGDKKNAIECAKKLEQLDPNGQFGAWARETIKRMK